MALSTSMKTVTLYNNGIIKVSDNSTTIFRTAKKIRFYCKHCGAIWETTNHHKTKHGHSANCPNCSYSAWAK